MAVNEASLRSQLTTIKNKTASAEILKPGSWWVGDLAAQRQVRDNLAAGRLEFRGAWHSACYGLDALDEGDLDAAEIWLTNALWLYINVLEKRVRPDDVAMLARSIQKRGRPLGARSKKGRALPKK
jgi:hypothetical protein